MKYLFTMIVLPIVTLCLPAQGFISVSDFEGNMSSLKVLVFLSKDCPCSQSHIEHLNQLTQTYNDVSYFGVVADRINSDNKDAINRYFVSSSLFKFPLIKDVNQNLIKKFQAPKTPYAVILKKQKRQGYKVMYRGGITDNREFKNSKKRYLSENLSLLTRGMAVRYQQGKSFGCYIRRI